jgi:ribonuclease P protein subunit RPR2
LIEVETVDGIKEIAMERVEALLKQAGDVSSIRPELADRYVRLAWKIKTRYNLRLSRGIKRKFCRKCFSYWRLGVSCRVRVKSGKVVVTCLRCGETFRTPMPKNGPEKR